MSSSATTEPRHAHCAARSANGSSRARRALLGLIVDLDKVVLTITADSSGGLLGGLLCGLAGGSGLLPRPGRDGGHASRPEVAIRGSEPADPGSQDDGPHRGPRLPDSVP